MKRSLFSVAFLACIAITAVAFIVAVADHAAQRNALSAFSPLIGVLVAAGDPLSRDGATAFPRVWLGLSAVLLLATTSRGAGPRWMFGVGLCLALGAQLLLIDQDFWQSALPSVSPERRSYIRFFGGAALYLVAALCMLGALKRAAARDVLGSAEGERGLFGLQDLALLLVVVCAALLLRVYALNYISNYFEGELSPYSAGATSLVGMLYANHGMHGPWAPLGILYYLPIYVTTRAFGTDLLSLRLSSALVGVLTVPLMYLLASRLAGRAAGHVAAALFALNALHIGWSRTDIHPHGVTTWPSLLLCYSLLRAYQTRRASWGLAVALCMGLTWHQYPSGQSAVSIPIIAIGMYWLLNRFAMPVTRGQLALVGGGVVLWFASLPLQQWAMTGRLVFSNPFSLTGPRALWSTYGIEPTPIGIALFTAKEALLHLSDVLVGLFYKVPYTFHQEWLPYSWDMTSRTMPWIEMPLIVAGLCVLLLHARRFESAVIIAWLVAAVLPGILAERAYPKRLSSFFPALDIVAAIGFAALLSMAVAHGSSWRRRVVLGATACTMAGYFAFQGHVWFSGRFWKYGEPYEIKMSQEIARRISAGTVSIFFVGGGYEVGKFTYLLLDHLTAPENRPNLIAFSSEGAAPSVMPDPLGVRKRILENWPYVWTKLRDQADETLSNSEWKRLNFFIADFKSAPATTQALIQRAVASCPGAQQEEILPGPTVAAVNQLTLHVVSCDMPPHGPQ